MASLKNEARLEARKKVRPRPVTLSEKPDNAKRSGKLHARLLRKRVEAKKESITSTTCADNIAQLAEHAKMHTVTFPDGSAHEIQGFTQTALGGPLGTTGVTVTRWVQANMLPKPVLETSRGAVYHIEEARSFVRIIGEHQQTHKQYRSEHEDTKDRIFKENNRVRKSVFQSTAKVK